MISLFIHSRTGECEGVGEWLEKSDEHVYTMIMSTVEKTTPVADIPTAVQHLMENLNKQYA